MAASNEISQAFSCNASFLPLYLLVKDNHILVIKWKIPCKHYVQDHTTGPYVRHGAIITFVQKDLKIQCQRFPLPCARSRTEVMMEPCILVCPTPEQRVLNSYLRGYVVRAATCSMQQTIFLEKEPSF